jgi:intein/homing endonuclease
MNSKINEIVTGKYQVDGDAIIYADTDSVAWDTVIDTSVGKLSVEQLFHACSINWVEGTKEYATDDRIQLYGYDARHRSLSNEKINYVYRHKVRKTRFKVIDDSGNEIVVTDDHSLMVERGDQLVEIKPQDLVIGDTLISIK